LALHFDNARINHLQLLQVEVIDYEY